MYHGFIDTSKAEIIFKVILQSTIFLKSLYTTSNITEKVFVFFFCSSVDWMIIIHSSSLTRQKYDLSLLTISFSYL